MVPKGTFFTPFWSIFRPEKVQNGPKLLFSSFSSKNHFQKGITRLCLTKSQEICFLVPKEAFWPFFAHFRAWKRSKRSKNIFLVIFIQKPFPKRGQMPMFYQIGFLVLKGAFWPFLAHFLAQIGRSGPKLFFSLFVIQTISNEGSHAYVPTKILKMVKMSYFEDFWDFEAPPRAKKVLFRKNSKNIWRYTPKEARNPELSRYNQPSCWNPRPKPPINELFWGFLRFWSPATGQKSTFSEKFKKHLEIYS